MSGTGIPPRPELPGWAVAAGMLLALAALLWSLGPLLDPLLTFPLFLLLLLPWRRSAAWWAFVAVGSVATLVWILASTGFLLLPFVLSIVIAYVLDPLVRRIEGPRITRLLAIGLLSLPVIGLLAIAVLWGIPAAGGQIGELVRSLPSMVQRTADWIQTLPDRVRLLDLPFVDEDALALRIREVDAAALTAFLEERRAAIGERLWTGLLGIGRGFGAIAHAVGVLVITPVLTFYLLRDWERLLASAGSLLPLPLRPGLIRFLGDYDRVIASYLRGQILVSGLVGAITAVALWAVGFPYAFLLGFIAAVFGIVPYLGLVLSLLPAIAIAFLTGSPGISLIQIAVIYTGANLIEGSILSPRIVGDSTGLHPVLVLLALSVGGFFFGLAGLLVAVPVAAGIRLLLQLGVERYRASAWFRGEAPGSGG